MDEDAVVLEGDDLIADAIEKIAVVRNTDDRAVEIGERLFEHAERGQVEVVGRLVEHNEVAAILEHLRQHESRTLTAGEQIDAFVDALIVEEKTPQIIARAERLIAEHQLFVAVGNFVEQRAGAIELHAGLIDVIHLYSFASDRAAFAGFNLTEAKFQQGGFSYAVAADDAGALTRFEGKRKVTKQPTWRGAAADIHARILQLDDDVAEVRRWRNEQIHFALFGRRFDAFDFIKFFQAMARLRAARLHTRAHPLEFFAQEALSASFGLLGDLLAHGLRFEKRGVVSRMRKRAALIDLDDACGDHIEKVAVVCDEDDRAGKTFQIILEPAD